MRKPKELYKILLDYLIWHDDWNSVLFCTEKRLTFTKSETDSTQSLFYQEYLKLPVYMKSGDTEYSLDTKLAKIKIIYELYRKS